MANTTNFGWETPDDTDLVKDGAAAIRTLGSAIDTSLMDLEGGTTGQVLAKNSNTDMDFIWVTSDDANAIQNAIVDAKGDIVAASANDTPARLAVGTDNHRLVAASGETTGLKYVADTQNTVVDAEGDLLVGDSADTLQRLAIGSNAQVLTVDTSVDGKIKWATPAGGGGGMTLISRTSFSNVASQAFDGVFTSTYDTYFVNIDEIYAATAADDLQWQFRYAGPTTQTSAYYAANFGYTYLNALVTAGIDNASELTLATQTGASDRLNSAQLYVNQVGNASEYPVVNGLVFNNPGLAATVVGGLAFVARTYTGFLLKSASTNITGTVSIFGVNKS
jgi:hypothetical protein